MLTHRVRSNASPALRTALLVFALGVPLGPFEARTVHAQPGGDAFAKKLSSRLEEESVVTISELGDLLFFGGTIVIPNHRPSVEQCGIWLTVPPNARPQKLAELRRDAERQATKDKYSPRETQELITKALQPARTCEADFKKRCEETRKKVRLATRKAAVADVRKAIEEMSNVKEKETAKTYLDTVLRQCSLEE